jgi:hypothetical protein
MMRGMTVPHQVRERWATRGTGGAIKLDFRKGLA